MANALTTMVENLESSLPAPGIILDPMTDPGKPLKVEVIAPEKVGIEDIRKYTELTSRVNESLQKLASENKVVRVACDTNEKLNELVMQLAMDEDMEAVVIMANFSRTFFVVCVHKYWNGFRYFAGGRDSSAVAQLWVIKFVDYAGKSWRIE